MNNVLIVSIIAVVFTQLIKVPFFYYKTGEWSWNIALRTGSMPSSHSAFVVALCSATGHVSGYDSSAYAISFVLAAITIHDAVMVRGESGKQARVINHLTDEIQLVFKSLNITEPRDYREKQLRELIGHTTSEVLGGVICGLLITFIYFSLV